MKRTDQQNRALHKYFTLLAESLNDAGYDMKRTLRHDIDIPWTPQTIKEWLWRPVQFEQLGKKSTTKLDSKDIDKIYETLTRYLGDKLDQPVPFPSNEEGYDQHRKSY